MPVQNVMEDILASIPTPPSVKLHNGRKAYRTRWYDDDRRRREKILGYCDAMTERQAQAAYKLWLTEWNLKERVRNPAARPETYLVEELAQDYLNWAKTVYVKHGKETSHVWNVMYAMQGLKDAFAGRPASDIQPHELGALRDAMIQGVGGVRGLKTVNGRLAIIKHAYRWALDKNLVRAETALHLNLVLTLRRGRSDARDPVKVTPIDEHWVALTKPYAAKPVQAAIDLQWLTGMRPGEAVIMRACDIDMSNPVWLYTPESHKTEHLDGVRVIPLGPRAQTIIRPFLDRPTDAYLFSPEEASQEMRDRKHAARKSKVWPSHQRRYELQQVTDPIRKPGSHYTTESYRRAIHRACEAAERDARKDDPEATVPRWNPHQLRHAAATRLNRTFQLEEVAVNLGHADTKTTRRYALPDVQKAVRIAAQVG